MDPWRKLFFQATGPGFRPGQTGLTFVHAFDPDTVATFGGSQGQVVTFGGALYAVPTDISQGVRDSYLAAALVHLATLMGGFRVAGATQFVLHMHRTLAGACNEEFTRNELQLLASLDCHFFYVAREGKIAV